MYRAIVSYVSLEGDRHVGLAGGWMWNWVDGGRWWWSVVVVGSMASNCTCSMRSTGVAAHSLPRRKSLCAHRSDVTLQEQLEVARIMHPRGKPTRPTLASSSPSLFLAPLAQRARPLSAWWRGRRHSNRIPLRQPRVRSCEVVPAAKSTLSPGVMFITLGYCRQQYSHPTRAVIRHDTARMSKDLNLRIVTKPGPLGRP